MINTTLLVAISFSCAVVLHYKNAGRQGTGPETGRDVTPCHIVMRALALSDLRGQGQ